MDRLDVTLDLMMCFPEGFVSHSGEFVTDRRSGTCFRLTDCETKEDVACKVLEWLSRAAYKTEPYRRKDKNDHFHHVILSGMNKYLGTNFTESDMDLIYTYLGNRVHHDLTVRFVQSGYDLNVIQAYAEEKRRKYHER